MRKRTYKAPAMRAISVQPWPLLSGSGGIQSTGSSSYIELHSSEDEKPEAVW